MFCMPVGSLPPSAGGANVNAQARKYTGCLFTNFCKEILKLRNLSQAIRFNFLVCDRTVAGTGVAGISSKQERLFTLPGSRPRSNSIKCNCAH
jgi:hypothetical protein